ncbi:cilia- and flagella-associated protein 119 [Octopus bimaculoides]|uniref:Coiled-coil domain-containing protein 189 n=1 Tax=Octopus bimaculoides TaxID=37653 RepID=A0A0L8FR33_OCTBM|nr:cilia- and flagella-associated protein 119 [Octopus bimaculoides]|eukprot:XP_014787663.1 PREDICTED: coiled-coil domain-containing protein C16orf93 homolog [Octopus bimaculoides]
MSKLITSRSERMTCSSDSSSVPKSHRIKIVVWNDLGPDQSETLLKTPTLKKVKDILAEIFKLTNYATVYKEKILLNLYTYSVQYAKEEKFKSEQLSAYFSIVKQVHEVCTESPFGNLDETFTHFKDLLLHHSVSRPPYSTELFSISEVRKISYHVINTYFRHFKLYKYAFTPQVQLDLALNYIGESESMTSQEIQVDSLKEKKGKCETEIVQAVVENAINDKELALISEKEEAKKYLRKIITEFLEDKINELKMTVNKRLKESEVMLNYKLENTGYNEFLKRLSSRRFGRYGRKLTTEGNIKTKDKSTY